MKEGAFSLCITVLALVLCATTCDAGAAEESGAANKTVDVIKEPSGAVSDKSREQKLEKRVRDLEQQLEALTEKIESEDIQRIIQEAESEARAAEDEARPEDREFLAGSLALQKLNPELTFCADVLAGLVISNDGKLYATETDRSGIPVRAVGLHFQHVLDPFSMFKSAFHFSPDHVGVEEVYVSWLGIVPSTSFTVGRFRQNFGVLNRWHEHDLDQAEHPLAMRLVLGDEGLVGNGLMVKWLMPSLWAHANELTLEVVDGTNELLFAGEYFSVPSSMLHLKNYYDLSSSTYFELGLTGMLGFNNKRGFSTGVGELADEPWRQTIVAGADMTLYWSPPQRAKYRSVTWRSELFYARKELPAYEDRSSRSSWGLYSYLQYQLSPRWYVGMRGDVAQPTIRDEDKLVWAIAPYVTFWQSEFVYLRLEYQHGWNIPYLNPDDRLARRTDNRLLLQIDFAAGPHKHEKY